MLRRVCGNACLRISDPRGSTCRFLLLVLGYVCFLLLGALVFSALELPREEQLRDQLRAEQLRFLQDHQCVSHLQLQLFLMRALDASNYGVSVLQNTSTNRNWDFTSALFFTSTVLSTTGYGHTVPLSDEGKAFCIIYSVVGIPFTLLFLTAVVQRVMEYSTRRPVEYLHRRWATSKPLLETLHAALLAFLVASCFFLIPAIIFSVLEEDWNFLESFYFCFISLSTIGLGDYVPGEGFHQRFRELYKLGITFYLILGLIAMLVVLETFCELQQMKKLRKMFYLRKQKTEDELHIVDQDHLSFSSASFKEDKTDLSPDEMISASPTAACNGPMEQ